ncbi:MAG: xanthine dehydrogenase family protein molybdopterin-binding subunit [Chloroflexi bacterium]|nr:xanthine dehydrogenase family protein molybdopterin-binding subunit [Chloroflexota bacterium]
MAYKPNIVLSNQEYKVLGTRPIRHDGLDKVTGRARYGADIQMAGLLHGKVLRSPHAHAIINSIDATRALALPGVKAVVTSEDLPEPSDRADVVAEGGFQNLGFLSQNCLARGKALYKGHAVAAVAATSPHIAEQALSLIDVDYEVLSPVLDGREAMKENAPILHPRLMTVTEAMRPGGTRPNDEGPRTNIAKHFEHRLGDVEEGFKQAEVIVEREFHTVPVHQGYIEPHSTTALWDSEGKVTIWSSSQGHFAVQEQTAALLGIPVSKVKAIPMEIGGGFGGKTLVYLEPVAGALSRKTGHPVKVTMSRNEVFLGSGPTSGGHVRVKMGATREGRITAAEAHMVFEAGAFPGSPVAGAARCMFAPYDIPNGYMEGFDVVVNTQKVAAYRAPGAPIGAFAVEQVIDEMCEKLSMDPVDFRLLNAAKEGTRQITGPVFGPIGGLEVLQATRDHPHYSAPLSGPYRGRGIAAGYWGNGGGPSSAVASVNADGTIRLVEGSPDIGGTRVAVAMQLAEVLGIPVEDVQPSVADTDSIGYTSLTGGSSVAYKTGWACYEAAQDVKRQMIARAASIWEVKADEVEYQDGVLWHKADPQLRITFKGLAARLNATGGPIMGRASISERRSGPALGAHIVDVEVDPETGKVDILRYTVIQDAGKAIHPSYVEGQMQGGASQGIGWALNEEYYFDEEGQMLNSSFLDYRMPISLDLPMIDTVIVETAHPGHPFSVRGVGELPLVPPLAAIANAVHNAIGRRMTRLPMSPGRILEALGEEQS